MVSYYNLFWLSTSALILIAVILRRRKNPKLRLPPGPKPWPIIGNLNLIGSLPHRSIHDLSLKYGPLMYLRFGSKRVVVGASVDIAKTMLKTLDANFSDRPRNAAGRITTYNYSDITWSPYGPYWRQARRMCLVELFSVKRVDSYEYIRVEETKTFLNKLYKQGCDQEFFLKHELFTVSLNVISRMVLGKRYLDKNANPIMKPDEFMEMVNELALLNGVFEIGDSIPWLAFLDLQGYIKRMKACSKKFDRFLEYVLDEHNARRKQEGNNFVAKDLVDVLLQLADDPNLEVKIERHGVKAFTLDLLAGGTESSPTTVEWTLSEMLRNPETFKKATEELDRVVGRDRWVDEKDMTNLPYIEALVKETFRVHPISPILPPRVSREDCQLAGYDIPKGTEILVSAWTIGQDPKVWENPEVFSPERFVGRDIDLKGQHFELLPFGAGRRMCPGYTLGLKVIHSTLANLLHGFNWKLPNNMKKEDVKIDEMYGLSTHKKIPLVVRAEPRLPPHLYADI